MINNESQKEYFNNNGVGFDKPHIIEVKLNNSFAIKVEVYFHNLKQSKIATIESEVKETIDKFQNSFGLAHINSEKILKMYVFDDQDDYINLGGNGEGGRFNLGLGNEGGKAYYRGQPDVFAEMYVYQSGDVYNLKHELTHGLTYLATDGRSLPTVFMEGIADYLEHYSDRKFNSQGSSIDRTQGAELDLAEILKSEYSNNAEDNSLVYKTGHALAMFLQEKDPSLLRNYVEAVRTYQDTQGFLDKIIEYNDDFRDWLGANDTESAMKEINALQIVQGEYIGTKEQIVGNEIKEVSFYKAKILSSDDNEVGCFSPVERMSFFGWSRTINRATNDYIDIDHKYNFLKVVDGQLTYCDEHGNLYKDILEHNRQVLRILSSYDKALKVAYDKEASGIRDQYNNGSISGEQYYGKLNDLLNGTIEVGLEKIKAEKGVDITKILNELININPNVMGSILLQEGKMYTLKALGAGDKSALSIFDGNKKVGELSDEAGWFSQVDGQAKSTFIFEDASHNLSVRYCNGAYMAVTEKNGQYKSSFIDGRKVAGDQFYNGPHLHENELLTPSVAHINAGSLNSSLLLKGTKILDHKDSKHAQYSGEQRENGTVVVKGKLLNDKGTDGKDDDVYEANLTQKGETIHTFRNKGFYITEELRNERGEVIKPSQLFIHDHGADKRFQLESKLTHLKLVKKDGALKLVPSDKDGNEVITASDGTIVPDEYKYIDPIFAHEYEKKDYSHKHVNIGLINLDRYNPGTLFVMKYDPNDYHIRRDSNGEILRLSDGYTYFTKVKLFHDGEEIGMLSNDFHNFKDKVFFSADYNYSYTDFLASKSPHVKVEELHNGDKKITFGQGNGDIGDTDRGYTDYKKIYSKDNQGGNEKHRGEGLKETSHINNLETTPNGRSNVTDEFHQSSRTAREASQENKQDTILKVVKSDDLISEGKHKANIVVDYFTMKSLYDNAEYSEKQSVLDFWARLIDSNYEVGALSGKKYYFEGNNFVIHDKGKLIILPKDKVLMKVVKSDSDYGLVITDKSGKVIVPIDKVENVNYELLSSSGIDLESKDSMPMQELHSGYDSISGLNGKMFDCSDNYYPHDHTEIIMA